MRTTLWNRSLSTTTVVLVLLLTTLFEGGISYTMAFGRLAQLVSDRTEGEMQIAWFVVRLLTVLVVIVIWVLDRKVALFRSIVVANIVLTIALMASTVALVDLLFSVSTKYAGAVLSDAVLMAASNVLIFSVWYWIIDPPGIGEVQKSNEQWNFLFPQRASALPGFESWQPRYVDYLYLAATTTLAFSPSDTVPLTALAKLMMLLQALISAATIVVVAGTAINNL